MNRRNFFKSIVQGTVAVAVAPTMVLEAMAYVPAPVPALGYGIFEQMRHSNVYTYNRFTTSDVEELLRELTPQPSERKFTMYSDERGMREFYKAMRQASI